VDGGRLGAINDYMQQVTKNAIFVEYVKYSEELCQSLASLAAAIFHLKGGLLQRRAEYTITRKKCGNRVDNAYRLMLIPQRITSQQYVSEQQDSVRLKPESGVKTRSLTPRPTVVKAKSQNKSKNENRLW
jgi:hypothetical protein